MKCLPCATLLNALLLTGSLLVQPGSLNAQVADSPEVIQLLTQVKEHAVLAENDAQVLESYSRSAVSWHSHAVRINMMKSHVNNLIGDFNKAKELRSLGSPWQQEAIDNVEPLLKSMADHLNAAIDHLNQNQNRVKMAPWQDYVRANSELASRTASLIRDYLDYGEAANKMDDLEKKLEIPESTGE
ncbi:MAG TPA: hypothetical protein VMU71_11900 [Terracidiphilus sp.]|jgi:hypothetical protein|nr:hypothetical protein [Terracidiphilus sp.]